MAGSVSRGRSRIATLVGSSHTVFCDSEGNGELSDFLFEGGFQSFNSARGRTTLQLFAPSDSWYDETHVRNGREFHKSFEKLGPHRYDSTAPFNGHFGIRVLGKHRLLRSDETDGDHDRQPPIQCTSFSTIRVKARTISRQPFPSGTFVCGYDQAASHTVLRKTVNPVSFPGQ